MFAIDNSTAAATLPAPAAAGTPGFFTGGNPGAGVAPTTLSADWLNMVQQELLNVVLAGAIEPAKNEYTQLRDAIIRIANGSYGTASVDNPGIVQLATLAEMLAGINADKAATPAIVARAVQSGAYGYAVAGGTADALTATLIPAPPALVPGMTIIVQATATNTGAATLNVAGLGAAPIEANGAALLPANLVAGLCYAMTWSGSEWQMVSPASPTTAGGGQLLTPSAIDFRIAGGLIVKTGRVRQRLNGEQVLTVGFVNPFPNTCVALWGQVYLPAADARIDMWIQGFGNPGPTQGMLYLAATSSGNGCDGYDWYALGY